MGIVRAAVLALTLAAASRAAADGPIYVDSLAPFADPNTIAENVQKECELPRDVIEQLVYDAKEAGIPLEVNHLAVLDGKGRILQVEITEAISKGTAWWRHNKRMALRGRLLEDGVEVASFKAARNSSGGLWGAYMNSCAVLHRCDNTLGNDITAWLKSPTKDAVLGEPE